MLIIVDKAGLEKMIAQQRPAPYAVRSGIT